jgi:hypothetical protein
MAYKAAAMAYEKLLLPWSVSSPNRSHINLLQPHIVALVGVHTEQIAHKPAATEYQKLLPWSVSFRFAFTI